MFFFLVIISVLTGLFKDFLIFFSIIFIHEMGHTITALYYKWNIKSIKFYPFGGLIKFDEYINRPIKEEFWIVVSGIGFQFIYYFFILLIHKLYYISDTTFIAFKSYHYSIVIFNLIPVYPLDGIKVFNILLNKCLPFKISHLISIFISYIFGLIFIIFSFYNYLSFNALLIIFLIINKIIEEHKNHRYYFNKFIFERYLYNFDFKKVKIIKGNNVNKMYKDKKHVFKLKGRHITEKKLLKTKFDRNKYSF